MVFINTKIIAQGASGSGKSTIIGLIERWYRPTSGEITLDGISVEEFNLTWLRTHIRLVQQEPVLFSGTVFANIAHGLVGTQWEDAPLAEQQQRVEWAARIAFAHDFITELPESYSTQIGQRGSLLSGGQKQRIAIARSIISDPQVLLLDEPTSALDSHAARIVQKALDNVSRDRTTLIIAHNLSTIKHADNIVVVGKGSVIEQGTHESLVAADGVYARMVEAQTLIVGGKGQRENFECLRPQSEYEGEKGVEGGDAVKGIVADTEHGRPAPLGDHYDYAKASRKNLFVEVCYILRENWELRWCFLALAAGCSLGGRFPVPESFRVTFCNQPSTDLRLICSCCASRPSHSDGLYHENLQFTFR
jgi:ATP-binding cassette subfamily B (MDR/TAP) protein 1